MVKYRIVLRSYESPNSKYGTWLVKDTFFMHWTSVKPVAKTSKILPLMREFSASGKKISILVRYKIMSNHFIQRTNWSHKKCVTGNHDCTITQGPKEPTLILALDMNQNEDFKCNNCINYQHKRCRRLAMANSNYNKEPCNCKKCFP